jgi:glycosyltransferase domain-containing protein
MSINNSLTIVLTLKDRVQFTWRWLRYAEYVNLPFKILIADGGSDDQVSEVLTHPENFPTLNYEYIRYPYDEDYAHYYAKVLDVLARVKTPFVVIADNDDFYMVDGLKQSVDFMARNPGFSSCRGVIGGVKIKPNANYGKLSQVYGKRTDISFAAQIYPPGSTLGETAAQRVTEQFISYRTNWYDVFRLEQAWTNFKAMQDLNLQDLILAQHVLHLLGNVAGPVQRQPYLYLVRQIESPGSSDRAENRNKGDHFDRMLLKSWSSDWTAFVEFIAKAVAEKDGIALEEARALVKQGYRTFMAPGIIECLSAQLPKPRLVRAARTLYSVWLKFLRSVRSLTGNQALVGNYLPAHRFREASWQALYKFLTSYPLEAK